MVACHGAEAFHSEGGRALVFAVSEEVVQIVSKKAGNKRAQRSLGLGCARKRVDTLTRAGRHKNDPCGKKVNQIWKRGVRVGKEEKYLMDIFFTRPIKG